MSRSSLHAPSSFVRVEKGMFVALVSSVEGRGRSEAEDDSLLSFSIEATTSKTRLLLPPYTVHHRGCSDGLDCSHALSLPFVFIVIADLLAHLRCLVDMRPISLKLYEDHRQRLRLLFCRHQIANQVSMPFYHGVEREKP